MKDILGGVVKEMATYLREGRTVRTIVSAIAWEISVLNGYDAGSIKGVQIRLRGAG